MEVGKGLDLLPKKMIYFIGWHDLSRVFLGGSATTA